MLKLLFSAHTCIKVKNKKCKKKKIVSYALQWTDVQFCECPVRISVYDWLKLWSLNNNINLFLLLFYKLSCSTPVHVATIYSPMD